MPPTHLPPAHILQLLVKSLEQENQELTSAGEEPMMSESAGSSSRASKLNSARYYAEMVRSHPLLARYQLSPNDVMVITRLWNSAFDGDSDSLDWKETQSWCDLDTSQPQNCLAGIASLLERLIISDGNNHRLNHHFDPMCILNGVYHLHSQVRHDLLGTPLSQKIASIVSGQWQTIAQMDNDLLNVRMFLHSSCEELQHERDSGILYHYSFLRNALEPVYKLVREADPCLPLIKLIRNHRLSEPGILAVLWVYTDLILNRHSEPITIINLISTDYSDRLSKNNCFREDNELTRAGICIRMNESGMSSYGYVGFSEEVKGQLAADACNSREPETDDRINYMRYNSAFCVLKADQSFEDLILPRQDKELLSAAISRYLNDHNSELEQWGVVEAGGVPGTATIKGTNILLYGVPGTGKTFSAGAIANALKRRLISIDASKLRSKWYGETGTRVRKLFASMRALSSSLDSAPVFLFNEADQIIHHRSADEYNMSTMENVIQNLFLEELETFPGIIIFTTNLIENIDEAYMRRFDIKLELHKPDLECRQRLWSYHLKPTIPGAAGIDCEFLARSFELTGGQISLIVRNACGEAVTRFGADKMLRQEDLIRYALLECRQGTSTQSPSVGFSLIREANCN
jgi:hypothetical protein